MGSDPRLQRYARILRPPPAYPVWSIKTVTALALLAATATAAIVFLVGHANILRETERTLLICAILLFAFMATGLYRGARVKRRDLPSTTWSGAGDPADYASQGMSNADFVDVGADDLWGCLLSIVVSIFLALFAGLIVWFIVQSGGAALIGIFFALCWVMYRALRVVFSRSRQCRGRLGPSLGYAAMYTTLYLGWLLIVLHFAARATQGL